MQKVPTEFAALIGIDWADRKHDFVLHVPSATKRATSDLERVVARALRELIPPSLKLPPPARPAT